jgi:epoxyqueuosine reductase
MAAGFAEQLSERVKEVALALGFDRVGVAPAEPAPHAEFVREWLARGHAGEMAWLARRVEDRIDPRRALEGARSAVVVGLLYEPRPASEPASGDEARGSVSRYAGGEDYHQVVGERLAALGAALEAVAGAPVRWRAWVDTGPVLERALAARAGLGWIGKNTCLIDPRLGSYLFLGVLLCDLPLAPDAPEPDHCGTCRACLDACPTDAFPAPWVLDARRCISYTTIELRGAIDEPLRARHGDRLFGCDACQEVCPWNQRRLRPQLGDPAGLRARLAPRPEWRQPALAWLLSLSEEAWRAATRGTAIRRAKWRGLVRNALVAAGNAGDRALIPLVRTHAEGGDPLLAEHARWALARLERRDDSELRGG